MVCFTDLSIYPILSYLYLYLYLILWWVLLQEAWDRKFRRVLWVMGCIFPQQHMDGRKNQDFRPTRWVYRVYSNQYTLANIVTLT